MAKDRRHKRGGREERASTQGELAAVHGVSQQAISKWIGDPRWKEAGFSLRGPWGVKEIARQREWRRDVLRERSDGPVALQGGGGGDGESGDVVKLGRARVMAQIKKLVAQEEAIKLDTAIKLGQYVRKSESEEKQADNYRAVRAALMQLPKALRQVLFDAGDPAAVEEILAGALRAICVDGFGSE